MKTFDYTIKDELGIHAETGIVKPTETDPLSVRYSFQLPAGTVGPKS